MSGSSLPDALIKQLAHPLLAEIDDPVLSPHRSLHKLRLQCKSDDSVSNILDFAKELAELLRIVVLDRGTFRKHVILKLEAQTPFDVALAAVSIGLFLAAEETPPCFELEVAAVSSDAFIGRWRYWRESSIPETTLTPLERRDGSFTWICEDTSEPSRLQRLACAAATLRHGYSFLRSQFDSISKSDVVSGTELIVEGGELIDRSCSKNKICLEMSPGSRVTQLDIAAKWVDEGFQVAAVNSASSIQVSGGFLTGAASALEENMCMQSTLFFSLHKAQRLAEKRNITDACGRRVHVPECGVVVSPSVHIFRRGADHGYAPRRMAEVTAVLSVSMPNRNPSCTDCPLETRSGSEYEQLLEQKFQALLWGTVRSGAKILILPEIGCGNLGNDLMVVGKAFGKSLQRFEGLLDRVVVMGRQQFYNGVRCGYESVKSIPGESIDVSGTTPDIARSTYSPPVRPSYSEMAPALDTLPNLVSTDTQPNMVSQETMPNNVVIDKPAMPDTMPNLVDANPTLISHAAEDTTGHSEESIPTPHVPLNVKVTAHKPRSSSGMQCLSSMSCFAPPDSSRHEAAFSEPPSSGIAHETPVRPVPRTNVDLVHASQHRMPNDALIIDAQESGRHKTRIDLAGVPPPNAKTNAVQGAFAEKCDTSKPCENAGLQYHNVERCNVDQKCYVTRVDLASTGSHNADDGQGKPSKSVAINDPTTKLDLGLREASKTPKTAPAINVGATKSATSRIWATHNSNPQRTECARQLGLEIQSKAAKCRKEASHVFETLDVQKTGSIACSKLDQVLTATGGKKPCEEELNLLLEGLTDRQEIAVDSLLELMRAWELYQVFKDDIDLLFYLYDGDSTGRLDIDDATHVIIELSGNRLSDKDVEAILNKIKFNKRSSTTRREFAMAVAKWQAIAPRQPSARAPATKEPDWQCTIQ